jgi:hypothetical protein
MGVGGQCHGRLYPRERHGSHCTGGWVGPRAGLDRCGKSPPIGIRSPDRPARSKSLYRLSYPGPSAVRDQWLTAWAIPRSTPILCSFLANTSFCPIFCLNISRSATAQIGSRPPYFWGFKTTYHYTQTPCSTLMNCGSARRRGRCLHNTQQTKGDKHPYHQLDSNPQPQ